MRDARGCFRGLISPSPRAHAGMGRPPDGYRMIEELLPLPSTRRVDLLVPAGCRPAASASVQRFATGSGRKQRAAAEVGAAAVRFGLVELVTRTRATISVAEDATEAELGDLVLSRHLAPKVGIAEPLIAVRVGADRPNGKPVIQLMDGDGAAVGFGKIGWNELTRPLVEREAGVLRDLTESPAAGFDTPAVIDAGEWQGYTVLLVQPTTADTSVSHADPQVAAAADVAQIGGRSSAALGQSDWWAGITSRLAAAHDPALEATANTLAHRDGDTEIMLGGVHGDWSPWNMGLRNGRLVVWDWERFTPGGPLGIDLLHYLWLVGLRTQPKAPDNVASDVLSAAPRWLEELGVSSSQASLLLCLHHLEMAVRFAEARAAGVDAPHDVYAQRLARMVG